MDKGTIFSIIQVVISALLVVVVMMQSRGTGMGAVFGGDGNVYKTKRGAERFLFISTIVLAVLFLALSLLRFLI
ncbi:MAG: preprotein translocase subunit SecG [Patescibacteria group bacterium]|jgi:preprotein translocase subunit SecG